MCWAPYGEGPPTPTLTPTPRGAPVAFPARPYGGGVPVWKPPDLSYVYSFIEKKITGIFIKQLLKLFFFYFFITFIFPS